MQKEQEQRLYYLDNLRILFATLIISVHVALAYAPNIWWFFKSKSESSLLLMYYQIIATISVGEFFLIAAYFIPLSYDKNGAAKFLKRRCKMYLVPLILGLFLIILPLHYFYHINFRHNGYNNFFDYAKNIFLGIGQKPPTWYDKWLNVWPDLKFAHLWFLEHLLVYSLMYTLIRKIRKNTLIKNNKNTMPLSSSKLLMYIGIMSIVTFIVRIWYHIDFWSGFLGIIQVEYANLPKYIMFVYIGMSAYRLKWFSTFSKSQGKKWLMLGITLLILAFIGKGKFTFILAEGGLNFESFIWSIWDCLMCMALNIGFVVFFRESLNITSPFLKLLAQNTFGVYIFHVPVTAIMQFGLAGIELPILIKFAIEVILGVILSFTITYLLRRLYYSLVNKFRVDHKSLYTEEIELKPN